MARSLGAAVARSQMLRRLADVDAPVRLGRYRLEHSCGRGAFGEVFVAFDGTLRRRVAIKVLSSGLRWPARADATRERLQREARALAAVSHPNVVQIFSGGVSEHGVPYLVMELVEGVPLHVWIERARPSPAALIRAVAQAARGLAAVHRAQLVHGDVKPSNTLVGNDGHVRVADFGLTRLAGQASEAEDTTPSRTRVRGVAGTPAYVAPEVVGGQAPSPSSDQYSLCRVLADGLRDCGARSPSCVARGLRDDPARRHPSADALADALLATAPRGGWSKRRVVGLAAVVGLLSVGFAAWPSGSRRQRVEPAPPTSASAPEDRTVSALVEAAIERGAARQPRVAAALLAPLLGLGSETTQAKTHYAYGDLMLDRGRPSDALEHYRSSYFLYRAAGAPRGEAQVSAQLVLLLARQGKAERAEHWVRFAQGRVAELPEGDSKRLYWINAQAQLALQKGELARAERLFEDVLAHADTLEPAVAVPVRLNLAQVVVNLGRYDDAIVHAARARAQARDAWGPRHALVGHGLLVQGQAEAQVSDTAPAAVEHLRAALDITSETYGEQHPRVAEVRDQLGGALTRIGDHEAAVVEHQAALEILREHFGPDAPTTAAPLGNMGFALAELGRLEDAQAHFTEAIALIEGSYGDRYPALVYYWWGLAEVLADRGLTEPSARARDNARSLARLVLPAQHPTRREIEAARPSG